LGLLAAFTLVMLGRVLFIAPHEVLSERRLDAAYFFVHWRYFGFHELASGNLALWNPHCACGEPFFGNFQSALLYPLNFLFLLAPLDAAINWTIALHVFLGGAFAFYWARWRGLHSLACLLCGTMFMFCGPHFLQIHAGHLSNLCTLIWAPLLFLSVDQMIDRPSPAPCLMGMFAVAMSILAGHPQYVFYMGVAAGIYAVLNVARARERGKILPGLAGIVAGGILLSAVQLFTGFDEARESVRSLGMSYQFAASYSFPPENFLTLLAPWCFGDGKDVPYWGRWFVTEVSLFVGVMGLALAVNAMVRAPRAVRRFSISMVAMVLVLALGHYTPVFHLLFSYAPGFNMFRGTDKFLWLAALFLSLLAGAGLDQLLRGRDAPWGLVVGTAAAGVGLCGLAILPHRLDWWAQVLQTIPKSETPWMPASAYARPDIIAQTGAQFMRSLIEGAVCLFLAAGLLSLAKFHRRVACGGMLVMTVIELAWFARTSLMTFEIRPPYPPAIAQGLAQQPGDYRIKAENPNSAMSAGALDIGGNDPTGLLRYARYLDFTEGLDYDTAKWETTPTHYDTAAWRMLRCRYVISETKNAYAVLPDALPRLLLVDRFRVMTNYHEIFSTLTNASFHPADEIILESQPDPAPLPGRERSRVRMMESSTDYSVVEADAQAPCLLLMTDAYSSGWRALAMPGSSQDRYQIMPANYCLQAIPLGAGHHILRIEYSPLGFRIGKWVSIIAWIVALVSALFLWRKFNQGNRLKIGH
jgi:hypothetical protein